MYSDRHIMLASTCLSWYPTSDPLCSLWDVHVEQPLHSQSIALLICHHWHVIQPVKVRQGLKDRNIDHVPEYTLLATVYTSHQQSYWSWKRYILYFLAGWGQSANLSKFCDNYDTSTDDNDNKCSINPLWQYPWQPCNHTTPGTRHTGKPVESSKEHTYQGEWGREAKAADKLTNDQRRSSKWVAI